MEKPFLGGIGIIEPTVPSAFLELSACAIGKLSELTQTITHQSKTLRVRPDTWQL
jgi:hypothetical protein